MYPLRCGTLLLLPAVVLDHTRIPSRGGLKRLGERNERDRRGAGERHGQPEADFRKGFTIALL
jgi:hypothetical protein